MGNEMHHLIGKWKTNAYSRVKLRFAFKNINLPYCLVW